MELGVTFMKLNHIYNESCLVTLKRIKDNSTVQWNEETLPDKELVRESLQNNDGKAPKEAHLQRKFSLTYNLRKRLRIGI